MTRIFSDIVRARLPFAGAFVCGCALLITLTPSVQAQAAQARLTGVVLDSLHGGRPLAGATVVLVAGNRYATADSKGRFSFESVTAGEQQLALLHPSLDSLDISLPPTRVIVPPGGESLVTLFIPGARTMHRLVCGPEAPEGAGVVVGTVPMLPKNANDTTPLMVHATWSEMVVDEGKMSRVPREVVLAPDANGAFLMCGVPTTARLRIAAMRGADTVTARTVAVGNAGVLRLSLDRGALGSNSAQWLASVDVKANSVISAPGVMGTYEGFEDRRRWGFGAFRVLEDHEKHTLGSVTDVVVGMRGVSRTQTRFSTFATLRGSGGARCLPSYFIDGQYAGGDKDSKIEFRDIEAQMPPSQITAVEVYSGVVMIPMAFDRSTRTGCGSIVVWTNRKGKPKS